MHEPLEFIYIYMTTYFTHDSHILMDAIIKNYNNINNHQLI